MYLLQISIHVVSVAQPTSICSNPSIIHLFLFQENSNFIKYHWVPHERLFQELNCLTEGNRVVSFAWTWLQAAAILRLFPHPVLSPKELPQCGRHFYPNSQTWNLCFPAFIHPRSFHLAFPYTPVRILPGNFWGLTLGHSCVFFTEPNCTFKHLFSKYLVSTDHWSSNVQ